MAALEVPAEDDLRRGLAVCCGDADDRVVGEGFPVVAEGLWASMAILCRRDASDASVLAK